MMFWTMFPFLLSTLFLLPVVCFLAPAIPSILTSLESGRGIADSYTWQEEAFELDIHVKVPLSTRSKDVCFKATSRSIDLRLQSGQVLLDAQRPLRGRINLDGTYWVVEDADAPAADYRIVTVTVEKLIQTPTDDFQVIDYDWKGVYANDTEVTERHYDEPEKLDVREYAASLGVDIDNINMSMVDKTMFSSGLNLTQASLAELDKAGYIKEVTRQADGTEYTVGEDGQPEPFHAYGKGVQGQEPVQPRPIPFLDTESPWNAAVPVQRDPATNQTYVQQTRNFTRAAFAEDSAKPPADDDDKSSFNPKDPSDPIDLLTVQRLKEILKAQGLKTTGNKKVLQDRLRSQVNALLQGKSAE